MSEETRKPRIAIVQLMLPYPPARLNPNNTRGKSWMVLNAAYQKYKSDCYYATMEALNKRERNATKTGLIENGDLPLKLTFVWDKVRPDSDNLLGASKAAIDGFALALKTNDNRFDPLVVTRRSLEHMNLPHECLIMELPCRPLS